MQLTKRIAFILTALMLADIASAAVTPTTNYTYTLNVAGSSAFADAFKLCGDSLVTFQTQAASSSTYAGPEFKAYGCTVKTSITLSDGATYTYPNNIPILVYYRSEGGPVYGIGTIAKIPQPQIMRLQVSSHCTSTSTTNVYTCPVFGWDLATDSFATVFQVVTTMGLIPTPVSKP